MICCWISAAVSVLLLRGGLKCYRKGLAAGLLAVTGMSLALFLGHELLHLVDPNICRGSGVHDWYEQLAIILRELP